MQSEPSPVPWRQKQSEPTLASEASQEAWHLEDTSCEASEASRLRGHTWLGLKRSKSFASLSWCRTVGWLVFSVWTYWCRLAGHSSRRIGYRKHVESAMACGCNCLCTSFALSLHSWSRRVARRGFTTQGPHLQVVIQLFVTGLAKTTKLKTWGPRSPIVSTRILISASTDSGCQRQTYWCGKMLANRSAKGNRRGLNPWPIWTFAHSFAMPCNAMQRNARVYTIVCKQVYT